MPLSVLDQCCLSFLLSVTSATTTPNEVPTSPHLNSIISSLLFSFVFLPSMPFLFPFASSSVVIVLVPLCSVCASAILLCFIPCHHCWLSPICLLTTHGPACTLPCCASFSSLVFCLLMPHQMMTCNYCLSKLSRVPLLRGYLQSLALAWMFFSTAFFVVRDICGQSHHKYSSL